MNIKVDQNTLVSVIIVNWNGEKFLERCLTALMAQTVKPHEIILLDNASTDGSLEIVRRFSSVRLIALDRNTGFAQGNNLAIEAASAKSEWIAPINPDAFAESRWLEALLEAAGSNPGFDVFGSKLVNAGDSTLLDGGGDAYHVSGLVWRMGHGSPVPTSVENQREVFSPCVAAALYRRSALDKLGGFDEDYFCYVEAWIWVFGSGTTGGQNSDFAMYYGHRNLVWTYVKKMPGILFWLLLPLPLRMCR